MLLVYCCLNNAAEAAMATCPPASAPPAYRARLEGMRNSEARARTRAGLALLARALELGGGSAACLDDIGFAAGGRPMLADGPSFSISHSRRLVACALAEDGETVGLDVEFVRDDLSPRLRTRLAPGGDFFSAWCAREATVKASGRAGLARIRAVALDGDRASLDGRVWHLSRPRLAPGYAACLASDRPLAAGAVRCVEWAGPA